MDKNGGMVAVVQGLQDSGLTVTLMDGGKQYTLMPEAAPHPRSPQLRNAVTSASRHQQCATERPGSAVRHRENGVQATDGRYASTYKMMHCNVSPTSPVQDVTEFPPQRPNAIPGSVCASRASVQPDAFANSLRKYPSLSPERSTEIVERLITFTQAKNMSRIQNRFSQSPTQNCTYSESSKHTFIDQKPSNFGTKENYRPEVIVKKNRTTDNSPVRERSRQVLHKERDLYSDFYKNDIGCTRDSMRQCEDGSRNFLAKSHIKCSPRYNDQYCDEIDHSRMMEQFSNNSVNIEIQAAAQMESKEILTLPRIVPMQKTVATSLSPVSSSVETTAEKRRDTGSLNHDTLSCKFIQVELDTTDHLKDTSNSFELKNIKKIKRKRSRSEEELKVTKKSVRHEILKLLQGLNSNSDCDLKREKQAKSKNKKVCRKCKHTFEEGARLNSLRRSVSDYINVPEDFDDNDNEHEASAHIKNVIRQCLKFKKGELGEKGTHRDHILQEFVNKLHSLASRSEYPENNNVANAVNIDSNYDTHDISEPYHYEDFNDEHVSKNTFPSKKIWLKKKDYCFYTNYNSGNESTDNDPINDRMVSKTEEELRNLIDLDILAFTEKYRLNITTETLYDLREELFDLLVMNLKNIASHNRSFIRRKLKNILENKGFSEFQSVYLTNILTEHWEDEFSTNDVGLETPNLRSDTFIIFPNITQSLTKYNEQSENSNPNEADYSINEIAQKDVDINVESYINGISFEINEWLLNLPIPHVHDEKVRETIVKDLANDIVDRHKYLELNPSSAVSEEAELENLKYQVFKWIYKLANNTDMTAVEHADDLMRRIQSIPVPTFSIQNKKNSSERPDHPGSDVAGQRLNVIEPSNLHASSTRRLSTPDYVCCKKTTCKRNLNRTVPSMSTSDRNNSIREPDNLLTSTRRKSSPAKLTIDKTELSEGGVVSRLLGKTLEMSGTQGNAPIDRRPIKSGDLPYDSKGNFTGGIKIKDSEDIATEYRSPQVHIPTTQNIQTNIDKINEEYDKFLKEWVETIPIPVTNNIDENMVKLARMEMYDGVWEITSRLRSAPDTFNNRFLYEDQFDDEIDKLLSKLPQSPDLQAKKHILKVKLIEKTSDANELMKSPLECYKQQLIENVKSNVPTPIANESQNPDILELFEELQILNLVEDFIIYSRYQNEDPIISEGYRNKLLKRTQAFVEDLKANHSKALKNIDTKLYLNDILNALKNVPLPSDETLRQEADEILLGVEIDKWFSELPVAQSDDYVEQLHRRRLRKNLAKQILEIEKGTDNGDGVLLDDTIRHEVSQFLGKAPLQRGESLNINVMVDELMQRLKNRPKSTGNDSKRVAFNDPDYEEFSRDIPLSSTFSEYQKPSGSNKLENKNTSAQSNKSIQAVPPSGELYHNIAKPLDDLKSAKCCNDYYLDDSTDYRTFADDQPISSSHRHEDRWYTLQDTGHEYPEADSRIPNQSARYVPKTAFYPQDSQHFVQDDRRDRYGIAEYPEEFIAPQKYVEQQTEEYSNQRRPALFPNQQSPFKRMSVDRGLTPTGRNIDASKRMSNQFTDQRLPSPHSCNIPRTDDIRFKQQSMRSDHMISPHRMPYQSPYQQEPGRVESNLQPTFPDIEGQRSPQVNRSGIFHRSTDQEGIRRTIERNKSMEATYSGSIPEHYPGYYQPSVVLPPGYIPLRIDARGRDRDRGRYMAEETTTERYRGADTDVEVDEEDDVRCRCQKMWKSRRRQRYCPYDDYDYPICLSTPYFYPYFY